MPSPFTSYQGFANRSGMNWGNYGGMPFGGYSAGGDISNPMDMAMKMAGGASPWRMKMPGGQSLNSMGFTEGQWQGGGQAPNMSSGIPNYAPNAGQSQPKFPGMTRTSGGGYGGFGQYGQGSLLAPSSVTAPQAFQSVQDNVAGARPSPYQPAHSPQVEAQYQQRWGAEDGRFDQAQQYQAARQQARLANNPAAGQYNQIGYRPEVNVAMNSQANAQDAYAQQQRDIGARMQGGMGQNWLGNQATGQPGLNRNVASYGTIPMYPEAQSAAYRASLTPEDEARQRSVESAMHRVAESNRQIQSYNQALQDGKAGTGGIPATSAPMERASYESPYGPVNSLPAAQYKMANGETGSILGRANQRQAAADAKRWYMRNVFNYDRAQQRLNSPYGLMVQGQAGEQQRRAQDFQNWVEAQQYSNLRAPFMQDRGPGYNPLGPSAATASVSGPYSPQGIQAQRYQGNHDLGQQAVIANYATENKIPLSQAIQDFGAFGQGPQQGQQGRFPGTPPGAGVSPWQAQPQQQAMPTTNTPDSINQALDQLPPNATIADLQRQGITPERLQEYLATLDSRDGGWLSYNDPANYTRRERAKRLLGASAAPPQAQSAAAYGYGTGL